MRLSTDPDRDEERALATIAAAVDAGVTVFDTARAYGDNERLLANALRRCGAERNARVVTKGGMSRPAGGWAPDGRAKAILADCEASLVALDGLEIDLLLIHAPDPRTPWRTTVRALARLVDEGLVRRVGVCNVNRDQLDEALALAPISAVQVALSVLDDRALRGGVVERCAEAGVTVMAHSPLGGPRGARTLGRRQALADVAAARGVTPAEVALAWLLDLWPAVLAIPGARRPETARSAAAAAALHLDDGERAALAREFGGLRPAPAGGPPASGHAEVVVVMGIPGAGKSRIAEDLAGRGYVRLNRDERGGSLRELADALEEVLASGVRRVVLDNTYLTRASRSHVIDAARRHGLPVRCIWLDAPLAQAQVNLVERVLDRAGSLPGPDELRVLARRGGGVLTPTSQMRARRELEPPSDDEGWAVLEHAPFVRAPRSPTGVPGVFVAATALGSPDWRGEVDPTAPHMLFDWRPGEDPGGLTRAVAELAAEVSGPVDGALCPHPGGPPSCWCRPPLPGLPMALARAHGVELSRSVLVGVSAAHRTLAATLGARYICADREDANHAG